MTKSAYRVLLVLLLILLGTMSFAQAVSLGNAPQVQFMTCTGVTSLAQGQQDVLSLTFVPAESARAVTWSSSNPDIAAVDAQGRVTGMRAGSAVITARTASGVSASIDIRVRSISPGLTFTLAKDKKSYILTGCSSKVYTVCIPATHKELPVTAIDGDAFRDCDNLRWFTTDPAQATFYAVDGVLFTDKPQRTLVRFPNRYDGGFYVVPSGTKAIGDYAFAWSRNLDTLHVSEGVTSMGSYVFKGISYWASIYLPNSLKKIGDHLFQDQTASCAFFIPQKNDTLINYALNNRIPYGTIYNRDTLDTNLVPGHPDTAQAKDAPAVKAESTAVYFIPYAESSVDLARNRNLSNYQQTTFSEVRLNLPTSWAELLPDERGATLSGSPAMTGVYGIGYSSGVAWLRGYDRSGACIAIRRVSGNFAVSLPGACDVGVSGCMDTQLSLIPYEPIFVTSGTYRFVPSEFTRLGDDTAVRCFVLMVPYGNYSLDFPDYLNICSYSIRHPNYSHDESMFSLLEVHVYDRVLIDQMDKIAITFDHMITLADYPDFICNAKSDYTLNKSFADKLHGVWTNVVDYMVGRHYPAGTSIKRLTIDIDGSFPSTNDSIIYLDSHTLDYDDSLFVYAHEMTHALDNNILFTFDTGASYAPTAWSEGRAEYIGHEVTVRMGGHHELYYDRFDWSFLSKEDKADFFRYWYYSTNRETAYPVGYYFYKYLVDRFGDHVGADIMANMAALPYATEETAPDMIRKAVTDATCETVFQDFVRDVINK